MKDSNNFYVATLFEELFAGDERARIKITQANPVDSNAPKSGGRSRATMKGQQQVKNLGRRPITKTNTFFKIRCCLETAHRSSRQVAEVLSFSFLKSDNHVIFVFFLQLCSALISLSNFDVVGSSM